MVMRDRRLMPTVPIDLVDLELFARIAEAGSITHGARRAHLALPSASARVANMERAVGTALLERDRRGVTLTPAGALVLRHARTVLEDVERMHGDLSRYADGLSATVRVRANTAAMAGFLADALRGFLADEPMVSLDLQERPSHLIVRALAEVARTSASSPTRSRSASSSMSPSRSTASS